MTVYADMIFLLNFCVDLLLLWLTMAIRKQRTAFWRLAIAACLGAGYATLLLAPVISWFFTWATKVLLSALMVIVAFGYRGKASFLRNWGVFYFVTFVVGGGMFALHHLLLEQRDVLNGILVTQTGGMGTPVTWTFIMIAFPLVWLYSHFTFRTLAERQAIHQYLIRVEVVIGDDTVRGTGLIDTGNQLRDPLTRMPVMMIESRLMAPILPHSVKEAIKQKDVSKGLVHLPLEWLPRVKIIPYRSITRGTDFLLAVKADKVIVEQKKGMCEIRNILVGLDKGVLSTDGSYQMILHPSMTEETAEYMEQTVYNENNP